MPGWAKRVTETKNSAQKRNNRRTLSRANSSTASRFRVDVGRQIQPALIAASQVSLSIGGLLVQSFVSGERAVYETARTPNRLYARQQSRMDRPAIPVDQTPPPPSSRRRR